MIRVIWEGKVGELELNSARIDEILERMGILPEGVLVAKNGEVVSEDEIARSGDEIRIIRAISGG